MRTRLALVAIVALLVAACSGGSGPTAQPTRAPTVAPRPSFTEAPETPSRTVDPVLVSSFCEPFAIEVLPAWPPAGAAVAGELDSAFRTWRANPNLAALTDDLAAVLDYLADARKGSGAVSPTPDAAEAFGNIEAFAAENC